MAGTRNSISFDQAAHRLRVSRHTVMRLVKYGELEVHGPSGSSDQRILLASVLAFEKRRAEGDRITAEWSRGLDAMGAPAE